MQADFRSQLRERRRGLPACRPRHAAAPAPAVVAATLGAAPRGGLPGGYGRADQLGLAGSGRVVSAHRGAVDASVDRVVQRGDRRPCRPADWPALPAAQPCGCWRTPPWPGRAWPRRLSVSSRVQSPSLESAGVHSGSPTRNPQSTGLRAGRRSWLIVADDSTADPSGEMPGPPRIAIGPFGFEDEMFVESRAEQDSRTPISGKAAFLELHVIGAVRMPRNPMPNVRLPPGRPTVKGTAR